MNALFLLEWLGTILVIFAYALNQFGIMTPESIIYVTMNLFGAIFLGIVLWTKKVYGPFSIQLVWGSIALIALVQ